MKDPADAAKAGGNKMTILGVWAIGILLGIKRFFVGLIMLIGGSAMGSMEKR
jgi:hypothetical protein